MQQEPLYNSVDTGYSPDLPLESLILSLKKNGFSIKPDDYIEILKVIERFQPATLAEAGDLICPLIVTNDEEQSRFHVVFKKLCEAEVLIPPPLPHWWEKFLHWGKNIFRKKRAKYLLLIIPLLAVLSWILNIPAIWRHPQPKIKARIVSGASKEYSSAYEQGDTIIFSALPSFSDNPGDTVRTKYDWNIGNGWQYEKQKEITWVADKPGNKMVMLRIVSGNNHISIDTVVIQICDKIPDVSLSYNAPDIMPPDSTIQINAILSPADSENLSSVWVVNGDTVKRNSTSLQYRLAGAGDYFVTFTIMRYGDNKECSKIASTDFTVENPNAKKFRLETTQVGDPIVPQKKIKNWLRDLILFLFLVPLTISLFLRWINKRRLKAEKKIIDSVFEPTAASHGDKKPVFEIPLENRQQQLIASEPIVNNAMRFMLQRTMDESLALNIHQTVQGTIRSGGIPELVYTNKLRPNDYLIVIDSTVNASQQLKLFDYLVKTFKSENISIVRFFYQDNFSKFYNEEYPAGFPLKRLAELYKEFTLLIYGTAHHLVYEAYPVLDLERLHELTDWENKGILTPVPFKDWGLKERLISEQLILLPADAEGQLRFIKAINEKLLRHRDYLLSEKSFYSAEKYDFKEPGDIKAYLGDEDLYQWICSIAVYPKIRWEVLIELGKTVLQSRGCPEKMNYSNLLRLVRISWLHEGYFPEYTRLELLKQLGANEQIVARKKMVELFQYADLYFKDSYFFSNEKKIQEITNKYILYTYDPANNENYISSKEQFETLWKQNKIADAPLKEYIENEIENPSNAPIANYEPLPKPSKPAKWIRPLSAIAGGSLILLIAMTKFGNDFAETRAARFLGISTVDSSALVPVTFDLSFFGHCMSNDSDSTILNNLSLTISNESGDQYESPESPMVSGILNWLAKIPYRDLVAGIPKLKYRWEFINKPGSDSLPNRRYQSGNYNADTIKFSDSISLLFATNRIKAIVTACKDDTLTNVIIKYNDPSRLQEVNNFIATLSDKGYKNISFSQDILSDSLKVLFYNVNDRAVADALAKEASTYFKRAYSASLVSPPGTANDGRFEILAYNKLPDSCIIIPFSGLPSSLNEIWKGRINNRLINIDLPSGVIYYSTGNKEDYGTYATVKACISGKTYRLIMRSNTSIRAVFIKNLNDRSFDLSVCPQTFNTVADAEKVDEKTCGNYDKMELYYDNDRSRIFFAPNRRTRNLVSSEMDKLRRKADTIRTLINTKRQYNIYIRYFGNFKIFADPTQLQLVTSFIDKLVGTQNYTQDEEPAQLHSGNPFDRSYATIRIETKQPPPDPCDKIYTSINEISTVSSSNLVCKVNLSRQGLSKIPDELFGLKNLKELDISYNAIPQTEIDRFQKQMPAGCKLITIGQTVPDDKEVKRDDKKDIEKVSPVAVEGRIQFPDNSVSLDYRADSLLKKIGDVLAKYPEAKVKFTANYYSSVESKIANSRLNSIKKGLRSINKYKAIQVQTESKKILDVRQGKADSSNTINYVDISYTNFPASFYGKSAN